MSVEEAKLVLNATYADLHGLSLSRFDGVYEQLIPARMRVVDAMNRLIVEVQAEMPCYFMLDDDAYDECHDEYALVNGVKVAAQWNCIPCAARQQLKEKDEAPTRVTR